jgi:RNA recognition motif-containing protein
MRKAHQDYNQTGEPSAACVTIRGLPWAATEQDIVQFFEGYKLQPGSVSIGLNERGQPSGRGTVVFETTDEATAAVTTRNKQYLGSRYLELALATTRAEQSGPNVAALPTLPLIQRVWDVVGDEGSESFKLMCWNVLAAGLGEDQFNDRPEAVSWAYRGELLLQVHICSYLL